MSTCTAMRTDGVTPCKGQAIKGGNVCRTHGGSAPQVRDAAARRILALVDPALGVLARATRPRRNPKWEPTHVELSAARDVLDRAGFGAAHALRFVDQKGEDRPLQLSDLHRIAEEADALARDAE